MRNPNIRFPLKADIRKIEKFKFSSYLLFNDAQMKRIVIAIMLIFAGLLSGLFFLRWMLDFDTLEGRGPDKKAKVKWAFKNARTFDTVENYLLLQRADKLRRQPVLIVKGRYWLEGNRYLEIFDVSEESFNGQKCLGFWLEDYELKCSINNKKPVFVCTSSFLTKNNILPPEPSITDVVKTYDGVKEFFETYPSSRSTGKMYKGSDIPQPLQSYLKTYPDTEINCWVERMEKNISKPNSFYCDESYYKCEASQDIQVHYP